MEGVGRTEYIRYMMIMTLYNCYCRSKVCCGHLINTGRLTMYGQVVLLIVWIFFILEVLGMLVIIGIYFTHNFTGAYSPLYHSEYFLTSLCSYWWVRDPMLDIALHAWQTHRSGCTELKTSTYAFQRQIRPMCTRGCRTHSPPKACS